jgi:hypothetical protein
MDKYYRVQVIGKTFSGIHTGGTHIIRGNSEADVKRIQNKFKISSVFGEDGEFRVICKEMNLTWNGIGLPIYFDDKMSEVDIMCLKNRRKGIGGCVWYEDENGNLQKETNG